MKLSKSIKLGAAVCAVASMAVVGSMFAYLTDTDTATNVFTMGTVTADLYENGSIIDASNPGLSLTNVYPTEMIQKAPTIKNTGTNPALVFVEVTIPRANVIVAKDDGTRIAQAETDLFVVKKDNATNSDETTYNTNDWLEITSAKKQTSTETRYVYAYRTTLAAGSTTSAPFNYVRYANVIEGQVIGAKNITVKADVVQQENVSGTTPTSAQLETAFNQFTAQNS